MVDQTPELAGGTAAAVRPHPELRPDGRTDRDRNAEAVATLGGREIVSGGRRVTRSARGVACAIASAAVVAALAATSSGATRQGRIAVVDSDDLSAIVLIPAGQLATTKNSTVLVAGPGSISNLMWAQDGRTLVYVEDTTKTRDAYALDVASRKRTLLATNLDAGDGALSPDGRTFAYWRASGFSLTTYLVSVDGRSRRKLAAGFDPSWSSDGRRLALVTTGARIETIGASGSGMQLLGQLTGPNGRAVNPEAVVSLAWAPDGRSFLVALLNLATFTSRIEVVAPSGRVLHVLSTSAANGVAWSPDGTRVAFADTSATDRETGVVENADGGDRHTVGTRPSDASMALQIAWSPDGRSIVTSDGDRVSVFSADGTQAKVIAYPGDGHDLTDPAWQP
jgi:WD40 repeat protein